MSTAFFQTYVAGEKQSKNFLNSAYANSISRPALQVSIVQQLKANQMEITKTTSNNHQNQINLLSNIQPKIKWLICVYKNLYDYFSG